MFVKLILFSCFLFLISCDQPPSVQSGKFSSMNKCLSALKKATGQQLNILRDSPSRVSGYIGKTKRDFSCSLKQTGSQGVYIEGWFEE
jgi:hypothetical protein